MGRSDPHDSARKLLGFTTLYKIVGQLPKFSVDADWGIAQYGFITGGGSDIVSGEIAPRSLASPGDASARSAPFLHWARSIPFRFTWAGR
jgi:hypothetical protein